MRKILKVAGPCLAYLNLLFATDSMAFDLHSKVVTKASAIPNLDIELVIQPDENMKINQDGPWKLEISNLEKANAAKTKLVKEDMNFSLPGFKLSLNGAQAGGKCDYKLTAFVCTKDKSQCFRDVHTGSLKW